MSDLEKWGGICTTAQTIALDARTLCAPSPPRVDSPIDSFEAYLQTVVVAATPREVNAKPTIGRLLLLGLISGTESYIREILGLLINACPYSRAHAAPHQVTIAAVDYYGPENIGRGLLESMTFSTPGELQRATKKFIDFDMNGVASLREALSQFETICQLRHACVHAGGELGAGNLAALGIRSGGKTMRAQIGMTEIHLCASICRNLVHAYNIALFSRVVERWIQRGHFSGLWKRDGDDYTRLFGLFYCRSDHLKPSTAYHSWLALRPAIRASLTRRAGGSQPV